MTFPPTSAQRVPAYCMLALVSLSALTSTALAEGTTSRAMPAWGPVTDAEPAPSDAAPVDLTVPSASAREDGQGVVPTRVAELQSVLEQDEQRTRKWWRSWIIVQTSLMTANVGWAGLTWDDTGERAEHLLNAGASALGALSLLVVQPPALRAPRKLALYPDATPEQRADKQRAAEELLDQSANAQAFGLWAPYVGAFVVGSSVALPLWLKYDRKLGAAGALIGSMAITAIQVWTFPTVALDARRSAEQRRASVSVSLLPATRGLAVSGTW